MLLASIELFPCRLSQGDFHLIACGRRKRNKFLLKNSKKHFKIGFQSPTKKRKLKNFSFRPHQKRLKREEKKVKPKLIHV